MYRKKGTVSLNDLLEKLEIKDLMKDQHVQKEIQNIKKQTNYKKSLLVATPRMEQQKFSKYDCETY